MSKLKTITKTIQVVDSDDLEQFIKAHTGHTYEIIPGEEWSNDSQHEMTITGEPPAYQHRDWVEFKETGDAKSFTLRAILEGLCSEEKLAPGTYLIKVCW